MEGRIRAKPKCMTKVMGVKAHILVLVKHQPPYRDGSYFIEDQARVQQQNACGGCFGHAQFPPQPS